MIDEIIDLYQESQVHKGITYDDAMRLLAPPLRLGQWYFERDADGNLSAFLTWAYLTDEAADGYVTRTRLLQASDWDAGDQLFFIDLIAPHGIPRGFAGRVKALFPDNHKARFTRCYRSTGVVDRVGSISNG